MPCVVPLTLLAALPLASEASVAGGRFAKKWWCLGPFASGKAEYDGDPLVPLGGLRRVYLEGPGSNFKKGQQKFLAEHATGGRLSWISTEGSNQDGWTHVQIPHAHVSFQNLMQQPPKGGNSDVLHVQYWMVGSFKIKDPGGYGINCRGLHTFHLLSPLEEEIGPFAGNIYSDAMLTSPVHLDAGKYRLMSRVRGKVPLHFSCKIEVVKEILKSFVKKSNLPDVVQGQLLVDPAPLDVRVLNSGRDFLRVRAHVQGQGAGGVSATITLAPGVLAQLPLPLSLSAGADADVERAACVRLEVVVEADGAETLRSTNSVQLRCRRSDQSALFSYEDSDGSVGLAAVLPPRRPSAGSHARPVLVSLSGVGVEPQGQADAYKLKRREEEDYLFGFEDLWLLAPQRDGPHNWEDVGLRSALRAVEALATATEAKSPRAWREKGAADAERLVVHGHSRGGHGAWALATRVPDRVLGVASACGWYSREEYGDANNLWVHETSLMHMDKHLLGLLHASIAMNENSLHASNLKGMPALVRVASKDKAVPPWFGRRMARHLQEEGANVTFEEFDQEHWWWDTLSANDGGVVHDASIRQWTLDAVTAGRSAVSLAEMLQQGPFVVSCGGPQYLGRFGLRILQRHAPAARGFLQITLTNSTSTLPRRLLRLRSSNVQSFAVSEGEVAQLAKVEGHMHRLVVDSQVVDFEVMDEPVHFCKGDALEESSCAAAGASRRQWRRCGSSAAHEGPIREVFASPWLVVVPDDPTPLELRLGAYFATGHLVAVGSATQLTTASSSAASSSARRVLLGTVPRLRGLRQADWPVELSAEGPPSITVAGCTFAAGDLDEFGGEFSGGYGAVFRTPQQELVITATDERALKDLVTFSFASNQPHTRAPMSNMLPDFLITGPDFAWKGYGGVVAAGFWDEHWRAAPNSAYLQC